MNDFLKTIIIAIVSGLAASLASPIINDQVQARRNRKQRTQRILDSVTDKIADIRIRDPLEGLSESEYSHFYKSANQLEAMGEYRLVEMIRSLVKITGTVVSYDGAISKKWFKLLDEISSYKL